MTLPLLLSQGSYLQPSCTMNGNASLFNFVHLIVSSLSIRNINYVTNLESNEVNCCSCGTWTVHIVVHVQYILISNHIAFVLKQNWPTCNPVWEGSLTSLCLGLQVPLSLWLWPRQHCRQARWDSYEDNMWRVIHSTHRDWAVITDRISDQSPSVWTCRVDG